MRYRGGIGSESLGTPFPAQVVIKSSGRVVLVAGAELSCRTRA